MIFIIILYYCHLTAVSSFSSFNFFFLLLDLITNSLAYNNSSSSSTSSSSLANLICYNAIFFNCLPIQACTRLFKYMYCNILTFLFSKLLQKLLSNKFNIQNKRLEETNLARVLASQNII